MAIYHLNTHTIGRSNGHSAVAAAAYRSASSLVDERTGEVFDFTRKGGVLSSEIITPEGVPVPERAALWNAAEAAEKRKDARVAREWRAALPHELNDADRKELATRMGQSIADRYGVAVDVCIHAPDKGGDDRNFHVHMLATTRTIGEDGTLGAKAVIELANKDRQKAGISGTSQSDIIEIRQQWAELTNEALERAEISARVDHRSYADQGVELTPTKHIGRDAVAMDRRSLEADRIDIHNADRQEQARQITERPEIILDKITATQAVFTRRDIAVELNRYIDDADQFQDLLARLEQSPQLVELEQASSRNLAKYSTHEMIQTEEAMADSAERLASSSSHGVSAAIVNAAIDGAGTLSLEQKNAVQHVLSSGSLAVIIGDAGTGKSFSMSVANEAWQAQGFNVRGAALAGKAADELQAGSGIESRTLASLEYAWKNGKDRLSHQDILVIDEAGMVGSRQLARVLKAAEQAGAKVVLLGDDKQLSAIEAGAAFRAVVQNVGAAEIVDVRRQKEEWARNASREFARGSVAVGLAAYSERGHVNINETKESAREALAVAYADDQGKGSQIILAHSNKDVHELNKTVRKVRKERGELADSSRFMTKRGEREFASGDRIVFLKNDKSLQVKNGTLGTVVRGEGGSLSVCLDSGEMRQVYAEQYDDIDHGYAVTIHKAQGVTVDRAYLLATAGMDRSLVYVGMTRHREQATLFAGADDFKSRDLAQVLGRQRPKESTLDFANRRGFEGDNVMRRLVQRGRQKVAVLAGKLQRVMSQSLERLGRIDLMPRTDIAGSPVVERPGTAQMKSDVLAGFRSSVERAQAVNDDLGLKVAQSRLSVAQEYQANGKDPRHHIAEIMQEGQRRALFAPQQAAEPQRMEEVPQVSAEDLSKAQALASTEIARFKGLAAKRRFGAAGYSDRSPGTWRELPAAFRESIDQFNQLSKERQALQLEKMQKDLSERYARDPREAKRDREISRQRDSRGHGLG